MNEVKAQRNYKDSIFRMLFKDKENLLSLYNALNKTDYTDVEGLEITTLENAVYMNYKNDVSFVFDFELMLYEHQSTVNPNIPLRDLFYVADILQKRTYNKGLYGSKKLIMIPSPRFVVFYNGTDHLTEAVEKAVDECIAEGILSEFLRKNRAEAIKVSIYEYDEELHFKTLLEEGREQGLEEGERRINKLHSILL